MQNCGGGKIGGNLWEKMCTEQGRKNIYPKTNKITPKTPKIKNLSLKDH